MGNRPLAAEKGVKNAGRYRVVALTVWPGLAQIWSGQEALGLLLGVCFASAVNLAIVSRWIWIDAFAAGLADFRQLQEKLFRQRGLRRTIDRQPRAAD